MIVYQWTMSTVGEYIIYCLLIQMFYELDIYRV